jgi:transcription antitermination factor NusG
MLSILTTAGVVDVIRAGNTPVAVAEHEISALERALKASLPVAPCAFVEVGQRVTIQSGPLAGVIGIVTDRRKADHVVLSVSLLQRSVLVQIDPSHIAVEGHIFQAAINRSALPSNF